MVNEGIQIHVVIIRLSKDCCYNSKGFDELSLTPGNLKHPQVKKLDYYYLPCISTFRTLSRIARGKEQKHMNGISCKITG